MPKLNKKKITIIANWKMNPVSFVEVDNLIKTIKKGIKKSENTSIIICPPAIYLSKIIPNAKLKLGIQNIFWKDKGAYTGEISAQMAKNLGVRYAIIGHSERRVYLKETDEMVNLKIISALKNNVKPILCIGESLDDKNKDRASEIVAKQIEKALKNISKFKIQNSKFKIAYEPIWAIGSGVVPTTNEIMTVVLLIRKIIAKLYDRPTADGISVLYGGSINSQNSFDFVDKTGIDGLLIGGSSLNASEFVRIVNLF